MTRKLFRLLPLLLAAMTLAGCNGGLGRSEVEYFGFRSDDDSEWGLMSTDGKVLFAERFENSPGAAVNGRFCVYDTDAEMYDIYTAEARPRKIGTYKDVGAFTSDLCPVVGEDNYMFFIDKEGNKAFDLREINGSKVIQAYDFLDGLSMVKLENEKWGFIDMTGKVVIPCKYADAWNFCEGLALVYMDTPYENDNAKWGVVDTKGNLLFTKKFSDVEPDGFRYSEGLLVAKKHDKMVLLDKEGNVVKKLKSGTSTTPVYNGKFVYYDENKEKYGMLGIDGEQVLPVKYSSLYYNGKIIVGSTDDEKYYILDEQGQKVAKLPKGWPNLFESEYKNYDKFILVGNYSDNYELVDLKGQKQPLEAPVCEINASYFSLAITSSDFEEEDDEY